MVEVNSIDNNFIIEDPGLYSKDLVCVARRDRQIPMVFVNQTNKSYTILTEYIVGRVTALKPKETAEMQAKQDTEERLMYLKGSNILSKHW